VQVFIVLFGGINNLHVPALSANRSSLCIVTHKIMHIEFSIIAMVITATLQLSVGLKENESF